MNFILFDRNSSNCPCQRAFGASAPEKSRRAQQRRCLLSSDMARSVPWRQKKLAPLRSTALAVRLRIRSFLLPFQIATDVSIWVCDDCARLPIRFPGLSLQISRRFDLAMRLPVSTLRFLCIHRKKLQKLAL